VRRGQQKKHKWKKKEYIRSNRCCSWK
jgi:hypothetical protein